MTEEFHARLAKTEDISHERNLLVIDLALTRDPSKSFPALIMKYLRHLGWHPTIVTIYLDQPERVPIDTWCGIKIVEVSASEGYRARVVRSLYRKRRQLAHERDASLARGGQRHLKSRLLASGNAALLLCTALAVPRGELEVFSPTIWSTLVELHRQQPFRAVLSIYGNILSHELARRFKAHAGVPWLAFNKDYYSMVLHPHRLRAPRLLEQFGNLLKRRYEQRLFRHSDVLLAHCDSVAEYLGSLASKTPVKVLPNCYDEEDYLVPASPTKGNNNGEFVIGCVGRISYHDLSIFFQALQELHCEGKCPRMKARFVGAEEQVIRSYAAMYKCDGALEIMPPLPHQEAVLQMRQATCLLFPQIPFALPRRTPEYMAARRPVLAFPSDTSAASEPILQQYGAAVIASSKEEIKATLLKWYREFQTTGQICLPVNEELVQSFSARHRAQQLNEVLQEVLEESITHVDAAVSLRS